MNYFRDLTNDECKIYDSWINQESVKTGENLFNGSKPKTNGDRIRHMTDEELAEIVRFVLDCEDCTFHGGSGCSGDCYAGAILWLRQEVSEDD